MTSFGAEVAAPETSVLLPAELGEVGWKNWKKVLVGCPLKDPPCLESRKWIIYFKFYLLIIKSICCPFSHFEVTLGGLQHRNINIIKNKYSKKCPLAE